MSKLSFRARALDAAKPLPVFRCEDLPDLHEYASINRAVPQMPTGMEKEEESVRVRGGVGGGGPLHKMAAIFSSPPRLAGGRAPAWALAGLAPFLPPRPSAAAPQRGPVVPAPPSHTMPGAPPPPAVPRLGAPERHKGVT